MNRHPPAKVRVTDSVACDVILLTQRYKVSTDEFTRSCLAFFNLVVSPKPPIIPGAIKVIKPSMPDVTPTMVGAMDDDDEEDESPHAATSRDLDGDLGGLLFSQFKLHPELHRVGAMLEDESLYVRQTQLSVEASRPSEKFGKSKPGAKTLLPDSLQVVHELVPLGMEDISAIKFTFPLTKSRNAISFLPQRYDALGCMGLLNFAAKSEIHEDFACDIVGIAMWLPWMYQYGLLEEPKNYGETKSTVSDEEEMSDAYGLLVGHIVAACAFMLRINLGLPGRDLRQDMMLALERSRRIHASIQQRLLEIEVSIHTIRCNTEIAKESLIIMGSKVPGGHSIYDNLKDVVPGVEANRDVKARPVGVLDQEELSKLSESL
jgi:hypothetical protein